MPDDFNQLARELGKRDVRFVVIGTVDLRNRGEAPLDVKGRVLEEGVRIYSSDDVARVALERGLLGHYHDYKSELDAMHTVRLRTVGDRGL